MGWEIRKGNGENQRAKPTCRGKLQAEMTAARTTGRDGSQRRRRGKAQNCNLEKAESIRMQRDTYRGMVAGKQEQGWNGDHSLGKKRNSEGNLRFHNKRN